MAVTNQEIKTKYFIIPKINPNASIEVWREGRVKNHIDFISDYLMDRSDISSQYNCNNHIKKKIRFLFIFTKNEMNSNELHELFDHIPVTKASNFIAIKEMEITNPQLYFYPVPSFFEDLIKSMAGKVEHKEEQDKNARIFSCTFNSILGTKRNIQNAKMIATFISAFPRFKTKINIVDDILQIPFFTIKISNFKEKQLKQYKHEELTQNEKRKRLIYNPSVVRKSKKIIVPCRNIKIAHSLMNELNFQTYFNETISTKKYLLSSFYKQNIKYFRLKFQIKPVNFDIQGKKSFLTEMEKFGEVYKIKFSQEAIFVYFFNSESALDLMGKKAHGEIFQDLNVSFDLVSCFTIFNFQFDIKFPEVEEYLKNGKIDFLYIKENYRTINLWPSYNIIIRNEEKNKCLQYVKNTPNKITQPFIMPTYDFDSIKHKIASFLNTNTAEISMDEEDSIQNNIGFFPKIVMFQKNPETQKIYISFEDDQSLDVFLQMYSQSAHIFDPKSQNPVLSSPNRQRLNIIYKNAQQTLNNPSESNKDPYNVKSNQSKIPSEQFDQRTTQQNPPENKSKAATNKQTAIEKHSNNQIRHQETNNHTGIPEKIFVQSAKGGLLFTPPNASNKLTFTPPGGKPPTSIKTTILNPHDYNRK